ncbi:MAG TPA: HAMP domain-containing sensor histidine kinase [Anaeromyxobacter sp.]
MFYLLLVSGAALVAGGAVLAAQARVIEAGLPMPRVALVLVAAFALTHGASDWAEMAGLVDATEGGAAAILPAAHVVLLAASFVALLGFALTLLGPAPRRFSFAPTVVFTALASWGVALVALLHASHGGDHGASATAELLTRWLLGLPASVCAAMGLLALAPSLELESWVASRLVRAAGFAFLVHGAADALGALPDALHGPWPVDPGETARTLGFRSLELLETGAAASIAILLSEAFVFQTSQRLRREETHLRDDFIALVAHELGNPVAALELATERLDMTRRAARAVDARLSEDVRACTLTLRRIVTDLLDTSRVHARQLEVVSARVEVRPALERAADVAAAHLGTARPVVVACPQLPPVLADPARLDQILGNLLTNAAKYSDSASGVTIAVEAGGGRVTIRVVNEGPGIDPSEASRIFSRSYRAHAAVRSAARGLGLGLYVARALVEAQGGRIWVESHEGKTAFCFTLPQAGPLPAAALASGGDSPSATA